MTFAHVPAPSRRFDDVGFSEIVRVRNRVMELLAAGHKVHRFEGGEPYMSTPESIKRAMESPIVVNGGMQGLFAAFATLLDPGDEVLMFSPYWTPVTDLVTWNGGVTVLVPT